MRLVLTVTVWRGPGGRWYEDTWDLWHQTWDRTIRPADRPIYGWAANPWVWVISFELITRPEPST